MTSSVFLTFVITTRNKKNLLTELLSSLISSRHVDEEIIIVDSNSTDGTREYLQTLLDAGQIDKFVSEHDFGEAHGFNKCLTLATGKYIKILSDDDVYDWVLLRNIKDWLQTNTVDVFFTNGLTSTRAETIVPIEYQNEYFRWRNRSRPFAFCGLGLIIRREAIPLVGLFCTLYKRVDAEFSLRVTSMGPKLKLGFTPCYLWFRRLNASSNSVRFRTGIRNEMIHLLLFYSGLGGAVSWIASRLMQNRSMAYVSMTTPNILSYQYCLGRLSEANSRIDGLHIHSSNLNTECR